MIVETTGEMQKYRGMGCIPHGTGVAFRVWAPHAEKVSVVGSFNGWREEANHLEQEEHGHWYTDVSNAEIGDEYRYVIWNGHQKVSRIDPRSREITNSIGNSVVHDPQFDWEGDAFKIAPFNELVIYALHVGAFNCLRPNSPAGNAEVKKKLDYLQRLGVNCIQLKPPAEFAGGPSSGHTPAHLYAVESNQGGPSGLKEIVKLAHQRAIAVVLDVVYNHFVPGDLHIWQFDGWGNDGKGGIYFYNDWRAGTPWGDSRPDYGRPEVRSYIHDNAMMWVDEYHIDGLRYDMTLFMRTADGEVDIPEGWSLAQQINRDIHFKFPHKIMIAEDLQNNDWLTKAIDWGGAGFSAQWDAGFIRPIRNVLGRTHDQDRSMYEVRDALCHRYNFSAFERVIYTASYDEMANEQQSVLSEVPPMTSRDWNARKRCTLATCLVFTAPGIPMIFQGQELLGNGWFDDNQGIDRSDEDDGREIVRLYRDLIGLRLNRQGHTAGLTGQRIECHHLNDRDKVMAFRRWKDGGRGDDTIVVVNFADREWLDYRIGFAREGQWELRLNSDADCYSADFSNFPSQSVIATAWAYDGLPASASVKLGPYCVLIYSENKFT